MCIVVVQVRVRRQGGQQEETITMEGEGRSAMCEMFYCVQVNVHCGVGRSCPEPEKPELDVTFL